MRDFTWIDFSKLSDLREMITEVLSSEGAEAYLDAVRISAIADSVEQRLHHLQELAMEEQEASSLSTEDDVEENVAATYGLTLGL